MPTWIHSWPVERINMSDVGFGNPRGAFGRQSSGGRTEFYIDGGGQLGYGAGSGGPHYVGDFSRALADAEIDDLVSRESRRSGNLVQRARH